MYNRSFFFLNLASRLIVNPDFVENQDESDGRTQFNPEDQEKFDNEI